MKYTQEQQRENLQILANHLKTRENERFDMLNFMILGNVLQYPHSIGRENLCKTVCCALGSGIEAGIPSILAESWDGYSLRCFGIDRYAEAWNFLFSERWGDIENTPKEAAERIEYYLEHGLPEGFYDGDGTNYIQGSMKTWRKSVGL